VRELSPHEKLPVLYAYLEKWGPRAARSMGIDERASVDEIREILEGRTVFLVVGREGSKGS
jgi:hypothetical protein